MNPTTNKADMQGLSPDQVMSSLAFATHVHEQSLPKDVPPQESLQMNPTAQQNPSPNAPQAPQSDVEAKVEDKAEKGVEEPKKGDSGIEAALAKMELNLTKKLDDVRTEVKNDTMREIQGIKQDIASALNEEDTEEKAK